MKKTLFAAIIILCSITTYAQIDSSKYSLSISDTTMEINSVFTNLKLSRNNKSQFVWVDCSDGKYLYFVSTDIVLYKLPIDKIKLDTTTQITQSDKPLLNVALKNYSNEAQFALILPILGGLASIPIGFPSGFYAIGGATALSFIIHLASYRHLKEFAQYNTAIDFNQW